MACCPCFGRKPKLPRRKATLLLIGLDNAGKTTAIRGMQGESLDDITPTVGFTFVDLQLDNYDIKIYDLGGGKKIRGIWKNYYAEVHGVIFVIDASAVDRLTECQKTLETVLSQDYVQGKRVLILANKQDQEGALDEIDICDHLDLEAMVNRSKCPCRVETCSAIQGTGKKIDKPLREGFRWLLRNLSTEWDDLHARVERDTAAVNEREAAARKERLDKIRKARDERLKREEEERRANGEVLEEEGEDEVINGDPFKKVDNGYFEEKAKKNADMKEKKKKTKNGAVVIGVNESNGTVERTSSQSKSKGGQTFVNEGFEGDVTAGGSLRVLENGDSRGTSVDVVDASGRTDPEGSLGTEEAAEKVKKKKKGKKLKKRNKVDQAPPNVEGADDPPPNSPRPVSTPAWAAPPRPLFRPGLETLPEQNGSRSAFLPPIGGGASRPSALPEIRPMGAKPNSEEDEGVMT